MEVRVHTQRDYEYLAQSFVDEHLHHCGRVSQYERPDKWYTWTLSAKCGATLDVTLCLS